MTRDTWGGDQQQPMSYNAWLYVYANPVNLTDPGGMCPDMNRDGKCDKTWECDLMPSPYREWCWGELGCAGNGDGGWGGCSTSGCPTTPPFIPHDAIGVGRLFVDLLQRCPGWWHDYMGSDTPSYVSRATKEVAISFVYKLEGYSDPNRTFREGLGEALAHQYWQNVLDYPGEDAFFRTIGSKSVVWIRLCNHYGNHFYFCNQNAPTNPTLSIQDDPQMNQDSVWNEGFQAAGEIWGQYYGQSGRKHPAEPYEISNVYLHPSVLGNATQGICPKQVYYITGYTSPPNDQNAACILTFHQQKCLIENDQSIRSICDMNCEDYKNDYVH
jgi:hypothetical protein